MITKYKNAGIQFFFLIIITGCKIHISAYPEPMIELISPYLVETEYGKILDVSKFNEECSNWAKIIPITNEVDNLEFLVIFKNGSDVIYYKNGSEYILQKKRIIIN